MNNLNSIDSSLAFVQRLLPTAKDIYKVQKGDGLYVLKASHISRDASVRRIRNEAELLSRARDVPGITHLVHYYGRIGDYVAILKEYAQGYTLPVPCRDSELREPLDRTLEELHKLRIAGLALHSTDVIVTPDGPIIVDLDWASLFRWYHFGFSQAKQSDKGSLDCLFE